MCLLFYELQFKFLGLGADHVRGVSFFYESMESWTFPQLVKDVRAGLLFNCYYIYIFIYIDFLSIF